MFIYYIVMENKQFTLCTRLDWDTIIKIKAICRKEKRSESDFLRESLVNLIKRKEVNIQ